MNVLALPTAQSEGGVKNPIFFDDFHRGPFGSSVLPDDFFDGVATLTMVKFDLQLFKVCPRT